ncbi:MAG: AraC family transcriptional regulator [Clostridiales bacterium]|nr:AraC family transcriptional regulator [Clostridiales bacterium]
MGEKAIQFWQYYRENAPVNVMEAGSGTLQAPYRVELKRSQIIEQSYIEAGTCAYQINGRPFQAGPGDSVLLPKHTSHSCRAQSSFTKSWVVFDGVLMQEMIRHSLPGGACCFPGCNLQPQFREILRISRRFSGDYQQTADDISQVLYRVFLSMKNASKRSRIPLAEQIRQELDSRAEERLTLEEVCASLNYSKNHVINVFRAQFGITPYQYFVRRKMEIAKLLLCNTQLGIAEIASRLSFADPQYFSNCFRQAEGCSPLHYRKEQALLNETAGGAAGSRGLEDIPAGSASADI